MTLMCNCVSQLLAGKDRQIDTNVCVCICVLDDLAWWTNLLMHAIIGAQVFNIMKSILAVNVKHSAMQ